jgi:alkyl sulfatase BDS1-like metallo-beta-lactamase superfamily hydrolase
VVGCVHVSVCVATSHRPIREWVKSLDAMRRLEPEFLVPSHTQPLAGKDLIAKQLTDYRDGIQWVYTATVRVRGW